MTDDTAVLTARNTLLRYKNIAAPTKFEKWPRPLFRPIEMTNDHAYHQTPNPSHETVSLKVHKRENFWALILKFVLFRS
jgi:hypothetical protein